MKSSIFTTDLHLTDHRLESYRFQVFPMLLKLVQEYGLSYALILGDLTDKTDRHASYLINSFIDVLKPLAEVCQVYILRGNHDYVDPQNPYFRFLDIIPNVHYINKITKLNLDGSKILMLPHTRHPEEDWKDLPLDKADIIFMHQTIKGSISENGTPLDGMTMDMLNRCKEIYSGDVHVPQTLGNFTYVGSPYHVHFGDQFKPRLLLRTGIRETCDFGVNLPSRHMFNITSVSDLETRPIKQGDQAKVIMHLTSDQWALWPEYREQVKHYCEVSGLTLVDLQSQALGLQSMKADTSTFIMGQQSSKAVIERFMQTKYPTLQANFIEKGIEYARQIDGV